MHPLTRFFTKFRPLIILGFASLSLAADPLTIPIDSPAFVFSPGNWSGDANRAGKQFRQTWCTGAYVRIAWETTSSSPAAKLLLDTSSYGPKFKTPLLAYNLDGVWKSKVVCQTEIPFPEISQAGRHELTVYLQWTEQTERWGSPEASGLNVLKLTGLQVDPGSTPITDQAKPKWALIIGDSITEGIGATELAAYSHLIGQALQTQGFEYGISACGYSGWLNPGDKDHDVPGYYVVANSSNGSGGQYNEPASRWNKIDGHGHSLLDPQGHLSAYGPINQEPALILINYGTNDALHNSNPSDTAASIVQSLDALRKSAPKANIVLLIPFGQYLGDQIRNAVATHRKSHPNETKLDLLDLGPGVARNLGTKSGVMGGLHPNDRGHALFAAQLIPQLFAILNQKP